MLFLAPRKTFTCSSKFRLNHTLSCFFFNYQIFRPSFEFTVSLNIFPHLREYVPCSVSRKYRWTIVKTKGLLKKTLLAFDIYIYVCIYIYIYIYIHFQCFPLRIGVQKQRNRIPIFSLLWLLLCLSGTLFLSHSLMIWYLIIL